MIWNYVETFKTAGNPMMILNYIETLEVGNNLAMI